MFSNGRGLMSHGFFIYGTMFAVLYNEWKGLVWLCGRNRRVDSVIPCGEAFPDN